jgi:hypothetical protein
VLTPQTGGRLVIPVDNGEDAIPRYVFDTAPVPEPELHAEDLYGKPIQGIDCRPISFEIQRRQMQLMDDQGNLDVDGDFDIIDCLESPLLEELDPELKDYIRNYLSKEERAELKRQLLSHNEWITELTPAVMACISSNMAVYPMGLGE